MGADLQLHGSTFNLTDRSRIDEANTNLTAEMDSILKTLGGQIDQGLGLVSGGGENQAKFDQAYQNAQDIVNTNVQPGDVDFSGYRPYTQLGEQAALQAGVLSGAYTTGQTAGAMAGYDSQGRLILAPGGVDIRPVTSQDIYNTYLRNPAVQAQMDQGTRQINSSAAAGGSLRSGSVLRALQNYGQGVASQGLGQAQDNLYKLAALGATSANQYAANLLAKYQGDQGTAINQMQARTGAVGQQTNLLQSMNQNNQTQLSFLGGLAQTQAQLAAGAASQRASSLASSASKYTDVYGMGYGGIQDTLNTTFSYS